MKFLISIFSILILSYSSLKTEVPQPLPVTETLVEQELIFDGYEGEYYFFTDANYQAVVLESDQNLPIDLINGNYEGKKLNVVFKAVEHTADSSSEGLITAISVLE